MSEYYAVQRSDDFLAHYGVKGMKWGVRKAIARGSDRALSRQYKKAQKKLAKLEKRGANGKKYAKRAAAYGAGAAAAGGLAVAGTGGVAKGLSRAANVAMNVGSKVGFAMATKSKNKKIRSAGLAVQKATGKTALGLGSASKAVNVWGKQKALSEGARRSVINTMGKGASTIRKYGGNISDSQLRRVGGKVVNVSNNTVARIGAAGIGAGLGIAAGRNAYKAATAKRNRAKAAQFRSEMNKAFAGTKYANGAPRQGKKRRKQ